MHSQRLKNIDGFNTPSLVLGGLIDLYLPHKLLKAALCDRRGGSAGAMAVICYQLVYALSKQPAISRQVNLGPVGLLSYSSFLIFFPSMFSDIQNRIIFKCCRNWYFLALSSDGWTTFSLYKIFQLHLLNGKPGHKAPFHMVENMFCHPSSFYSHGCSPIFLLLYSSAFACT